jgi:hypothetical protein
VRANLLEEEGLLWNLAERRAFIEIALLDTSLLIGPPPRRSVSLPAAARHHTLPINEFD